MQHVQFPEFLAQRYSPCVYASFTEDVLQQYPHAPVVLHQTWQKLMDLNTCPYNFRLIYPELPVTSEIILSSIKGMSIDYGDPSVSFPPRIPWFKYWMELFFIEDKMPNYLFIDVPICFIRVSIEPETKSVLMPEWMIPYLNEVPIYNLAISSVASSSANVDVVREVSIDAFYNFVLKITHYKAAPRLTSIREITEKYVNDYWGGFTNQMKRLFGYSRIDRATLEIKLKQLGDLCFCCGDYASAYKYYKQLYDESSSSDQLLQDNLTIVMSVAAILSLEDIEFSTVLQPLVQVKTLPVQYKQFQAYFLYAYFSLQNQRSSVARQSYMRILKLLNIKDSQYQYPLSAGSNALLMEACSYATESRKSTLYLFRAADYYKKLGLIENAQITLWRSFNTIKFTGWPKLEQVLLLSIASIGQTPSQLQHQLVQRNIFFVNKTIEQLRRLEMNQPVNIGSVVAHDIVVNVTGFYFSPAPPAINPHTWTNIQKKLFPVGFHPSTEQFASAMWSTDSIIDKINAGVGERHTIDFSLTPSNNGECKVSKLQYLVDPQFAAESEAIEKFHLTCSKRLSMKFKPLITEPFQIKGVKFMWNGVAPVAIFFQNSIHVVPIDKPPVCKFKIIEAKPTAFIDLPYVIKAKATKISGDISSMFVTTETDWQITLVNPPIVGYFQKWSLTSVFNETNDIELEFRATPLYYGPHTIHVFFSYMSMGSRVNRFVHRAIEVNCIPYPKLTPIFGNNYCYLDSHGEITSVICESIDFERTDQLIKINGITQSCSDQMIVNRSVSGQTKCDVFQIPHLFVSFNDPSEVRISDFPQIYVLSIDIMCIGNETGVAQLIQPDDCNWYWIGKTKFNLKGPIKQHISCKMYIQSKFTEDIGNNISITYKSQPILVHHIVRIQ